MIHVELMNLPTTIKGFVIPKDGCYTIVINANLSRENQQEAYLHEYFHIINGDTEKTQVELGILEKEAHNIRCKENTQWQQHENYPQGTSE